MRSNQVTVSLALTLLSLLVEQGAEATLTSNTTVACPDEVIQFTCTLPGSLIRWEVVGPLTPGMQPVMDTISLRMGNPMASSDTANLLFDGVLTDVSGGSATAILTTVTEVSLLDGAMVTCIGESSQADPLTITVADPPSPPLDPRVTSTQDGPSSSNVTIEWELPSNPGGVSVHYTLSVSPSPLSESPVTVETTSAQITVEYNNSYNVSITAENCAGMSHAMLPVDPIVACPSNPSPATGLEINSVPSVPTVGSMLSFTCTDTNSMIPSTCDSEGRWSPDPETYVCPTTSPPVTCPAPSNPANGTILDGPTDPSDVGTIVYYRCNDNLFPPGNLSSTCGRNGMWSPINPQNQLCSTEPFTCSLPDPPTNGFVELTSNITIVFGCNETFSPQQNRTANCTVMNQWSSLPEEIMCMIITVPTASSIAPLVGGVVGGLLFLIVLIVIIIIVLLVVSKHQDKYRASEQGIELTEQSEGHYSETTHTGPRSGARQNRAPPPEVDGYNRIDRPLDAAPEAYDDVTLNSEPRVAVNNNGYSALDGNQGPPRLPGYGQLNNVATVEPVIYADLTPRGAKPANTAQVDQHRVDYADVDHIATQRRAATMPASPVKPPPPALDKAAAADKLLNLDQALVQLRTVQPRWQELAGALRVPETYIQQVEDMYRSDHASAMTEVVDYWMRSCSGKPTWRELADALRMIKEDHLAQQLMGIYETGRLPVELDMNEVPPDMYKYDNAPPPPVPTRSPTMNETDSPGLSRTLPARPPRHNNAPPAPLRPPKPASKDEFALPPRPPKPPPKH